MGSVAGANALFTVLDKNGDGQLDANEAPKWLSCGQSSPQPVTLAQFNQRIEDLFDPQHAFEKCIATSPDHFCMNFEPSSGLSTIWDNDSAAVYFISKSEQKSPTVGDRLLSVAAGLGRGFLAILAAIVSLAALGALLWSPLAQDVVGDTFKWSGDAFSDAVAPSPHSVATKQMDELRQTVKNEFVCTTPP